MSPPERPGPPNLLPRLAALLAACLLAGCGSVRGAPPSPPAARAASPAPASGTPAPASGTAAPASGTPAARKVGPSPASPPASPASGTPPATGTSPSPAQPASLRSAGWTTYQRDPARTGFDPAEPPAASIRRAWSSPALDGAVYAQPLVSGGRVYAATEGDSVYALDAATGTIVWRRHLGAPVPGGALPCGNLNPSGITATPVVDPAAGRLYVVAFLDHPPHHVLYALDLATGAVVFQRPVDPSGADPRVEQERGALALADGRVYVPYGGLFGDCGAYHGWVVGVPAGGAGREVSFRVPSQREAGIWAPGGPAVGSSGGLWVTTGNSSSTGRFDDGDTVLHLSPTLKLLGWFAPSDWVALNRGDLDLGSLGPTLLGGGRVLQVGKTGVGYLLRAGNPGGIGGQLFSAPVCRPSGGFAAFGATAYDPPDVFVPCRTGLAALRAGARRFTVLWRGPRFPAGPPVVAGGAVWTLDLAAGRLYGLDPATGRVRFDVAVGPLPHFAAPSVAGGRLFVPSGDRIVAFSGV